MFLTSFGHQQTHRDIHLDKLSSSLDFHSTEVPTYQMAAKPAEEGPQGETLKYQVINFSLLSPFHFSLFEFACVYPSVFLLINFIHFTDVGSESIDPLRWLQKESQENSSGS